MSHHPHISHPHPTSLPGNRATTILPHHRFPQSHGAPLARIKGTVVQVFSGPENHHGANHQHFIVKIDQVKTLDGASFAADTLVGTEVFVAVRFGDTEGLDHEIKGLEDQQPIELQGEYIASADAYPTEDNTNPVRPVLHFTHHPVGFVDYQGVHYS